MSAEVAAQRVLFWVVALDRRPSAAQSVADPLPAGALWETGNLATPGPATLGLAGEVGRITAARLGAGAPPFGSRDAIGLGPVLLAAAVGGRQQPDQARRLAVTLPASRPVRARPDEGGWYDLVARHGVVAAVLAHFPVTGSGSAASPAGPHPGSPDEPLTEVLLGASPLTAILHRPALRRLTAGATGDEVEAAAALAQRPRGRAVLSAALSQWSPDPEVLNWRVELLNRLRTDHQDLVLDTYTLARLRHGSDWDTRLSWAKRALSVPGPPDPLAIATVRFWAPLARLRQHGVALADVRPLLAEYRPALQLVGYYRLLTTGAA